MNIRANINNTIDLGEMVTLDDMWSVTAEHNEAVVGVAARGRMERSSEYLASLVADRRRIYGVTTGYGPLANCQIVPEQAQTLQRNLIYHLASGIGQPLAPIETRAVMATRLVSLSRGYSAIGAQAFDLLLTCLNRNLLPRIPEIGTVGASGDLTPLAHLALALIGEGEMLVDGVMMPAGKALASAGLSPVTLGHKEGLALVNGTATMTGIAAVNAVRARRAVAFGLRLALFLGELRHGRDVAFDGRLGLVRPHPGQRKTHALLTALAQDSNRLVRSIQPPPRIDAETEAQGVATDRENPQDPYTIRCLPQIFGAIFDMLDFCNEVVIREVNSVTDNPLVFADDEAVVHGGNFYGQHVGFASDCLASAIIKLGVHAERCIARICDPTLNGGLPPFLQQGPTGLNSGLMGAQVTASALVAEMRVNALPAAIQSIPTNNNNQDVVSMGTIAARKTGKLVDYVWHILAIEAMAYSQALDLMPKDEVKNFSQSSRQIAERVREISPFIDKDRPLSPEIIAAATQLQNYNWSAELDEAA
jgi:tyrosine ammonia-lyase